MQRAGVAPSKGANPRDSTGMRDKTPKAEASSQPYERRIIMTNLCLTTAGLAVAFPCLYWLLPVPPLPTLTHRLVYALRLQTPAFLLLGAAILNVSLIRLHTPAVDPINGGSEHHVLFANRFLVNSVEQTLLNVSGQLVLATFLSEREMSAVPALVVIFVFGRVTFYLGYRSSYLRRTVGFTSTFVVSMVLWLVNAGFVARALANSEAISV